MPVWSTSWITRTFSFGLPISMELFNLSQFCQLLGLFHFRFDSTSGFDWSSTQFVWLLSTIWLSCETIISSRPTTEAITSLRAILLTTKSSPYRLYFFVSLPFLLCRVYVAKGKSIFFLSTTSVCCGSFQPSSAYGRFPSSTFNRSIYSRSNGRLKSFTTSIPSILSHVSFQAPHKRGPYSSSHTHACLLGWTVGSFDIFIISSTSEAQWIEVVTLVDLGYLKWAAPFLQHFLGSLGQNTSWKTYT